VWTLGGGLDQTESGLLLANSQHIAARPNYPQGAGWLRASRLTFPGAVARRPLVADSRRTQAAVAEMVEPQSHRRTFDEYSAYSLPNNDERMRSSGLIWNRVINTAKITGPSIAQTLRR
jgi:hypothetical protein